MREEPWDRSEPTDSDRAYAKARAIADSYWQAQLPEQSCPDAQKFKHHPPHRWRHLADSENPTHGTWCPGVGPEARADRLAADRDRIREMPSWPGRRTT